MSVRCNICGTQNIDISKFCMSCGSNLTSAPSSPPRVSSSNQYKVIYLKKMEGSLSDFMTEGEHYQLVKDTVSGENMDKIFEREGSPGLPEKKVLDVAKGVLKILEELHKKSPSLIYCDIKPSNIIVHRDGRIMLVDPDSIKEMQKPSRYAPSEQLQGKIDHRSAIYSLGSTMYHLLTGIVPDQFNRYRLGEIIPGISPDIDNIVMKSIEPVPDNRFSSVTEMRETLEKLSFSKNTSVLYELPLRKEHHPGQENQIPLKPQVTAILSPEPSIPVQTVTVEPNRPFFVKFFSAIVIMICIVIAGGYIFYSRSAISAYVRIQQGLMAYDKENYKEAIEYFNLAIKSSPGDKEAINWKVKSLIKLGESLFAQERYKDFIKCFDEIVKLENKSDDMWYKNGYSLYRLGEYNKAIECFDKAINLNQKNSQAWYYKGEVFSRLKKDDRALKCYDKAISVNPGYSFAWYKKGVILDKKGKYEEAIKCYDRALMLNPPVPDALNKKKEVLCKVGDNFYKQKKYKEAIVYYDEIMKINPDSSSAKNGKKNSLYKLGNMKYAQGKYDDAIVYYDKALSVDPEFSNARISKRDGLYAMGNYLLNNAGYYPGAIQYYERALAIDPGFSRALYSKAEALYYQGNSLCENRNYLGGIQCYEQAIAIDPENSKYKTAKENARNTYYNRYYGYGRSYNNNYNSGYNNYNNNYNSGYYGNQYNQNTTNTYYPNY